MACYIGLDGTERSGLLYMTICLVMGQGEVFLMWLVVYDYVSVMGQGEVLVVYGCVCFSDGIVSSGLLYMDM